MSYLVDSDWLIDALAGVPTALDLLEDKAASGVAVSIVSLGEIFEGAHGFPNPTVHLGTFQEFLAGFKLLNLTSPIMEIFAEQRHQLRRQGTLIPDLDLLIAATALHHNLILMTRNRRHFTRIEHLVIY